MPKKITGSLDELDRLIAEVKEYKQQFEARAILFIQKIAEVGVQEASFRFTTAIYSGDNDVTVTLEPTATGWTITADGQAVAFIEFGAGVHHNTAEPYPNPRPAGIVGIGKYGKCFGKRQAWGFYQDGTLIITHGTPAAMPLYYATVEMERKIEQVAREVFGR